MQAENPSTDRPRQRPPVAQDPRVSSRTARTPTAIMPDRLSPGEPHRIVPYAM